MRSLSRREICRLFGGTVAWWMTASLLPWSRSVSAETHSCVVRPEQTEGPYFVDERLNRSDIRSDPTDDLVKPGTPLNLALIISRMHAGACQPAEGAQVDVWHCDALGQYSDVDDPRFSTRGQKFLRGYQRTNAQGEARFLTIYPGWYPGRAVHIHIKVRTAPEATGGYAFTSQMYFPDSLTDEVHSQLPYAGKGERWTRNQDDRIFRRGGERLMLSPTRTISGYEATFAIALQVP